MSKNRVVVELICPSSAELPFFSKDELSRLLESVYKDLNDDFETSFTLAYKPGQADVFCYSRLEEGTDEVPTVIVHMYTNFGKSSGIVNTCHDIVQKNLKSIVNKKSASKNLTPPNIFILEYSLH